MYDPRLHPRCPFVPNVEISGGVDPSSWHGELRTKGTEPRTKDRHVRSSFISIVFLARAQVEMSSRKRPCLVLISALF